MKNKRHMINVSSAEYRMIEEYCKKRNIIVSKWIMTACIEKINEIVSGSAGKQQLNG